MRNRTILMASMLAAALLSGRAGAEVVFSEIMYHPADAPDGRDGDLFEYIELYNGGAVPETLTGAYFSKGITYTFSNDFPTVLSPGDYLVIVKDRDAFQSRYPGVTNLAPGTFTGKLDNGGEKVTLKIGAVSVTTTYGTTNEWPSAADGYGPSLERYWLHPGDESSVNWSASGAPTNWIQAAWTGQLNSASVTVAFFLDYDGQCLIDDVSLKAVGFPDELVSNGTFEAGLSGWSVTNSHSQSRVESGLGAGGGAALAVQCNESRWYLAGPPYSITFYGDAYSNRVVSAPIPVTPGATYALSWRARRVGFGGTVYSVIDGSTNSVSFANQGSPGSANPLSTALLPIGVTNVMHTYAPCPTGTPNVVRAKVSTPSEVAGLSLAYQVVGTNQYRYTDGTYASLAMRDDGVAPDTAAADGTYAAYIPGVAANMTLVRYHVIATATNGFTARYPRDDDPSRDCAYWVQALSPQTNLPNWQFLMDGIPLNYPHSRHLCAISPDGQIFTDIQAKHRGNADSGNLDHSGLGIHFHRTQKYDAWFAQGQSQINIRHRLNNLFYFYRRVVAEPLAYDMQRMIGLPTPRLRFICAWINGFPTITTELEAPDEPYMTDNGISSADYVSRQTYSEGRETVGGDTNLDNFASLQAGLISLNAANRTAFVRTNLCHEVNRHSLALLSLTGNGDQDFDWNMVQHRSTDGRWRQYPWDVDISFDVTFSNAWATLTTLHPYYKTPLHPSIWNSGSAGPLGLSLFYPESGDDSTLPYRYRQQMSLWRYCHTLYTTNLLYPKIDLILDTLTPAYRGIKAYSSTGSTLNALTNEANNVKRFIAERRAFLMSGTWSDKREDIWAPEHIYHPSNAVISEIMTTPPAGGVYVELYNRGLDTIDLSRWTLNASGYTGTLPFGAMLGPTSFVVLAASPAVLTNTYAELGHPATMIERYPGTPIWDWPIAFESATEYTSRVIGVPGLALSSYGATLELRDMFGNLMDSVSYSGFAPWPNSFGVAIERIDPTSSDTGYSAWRSSTVVGTPGGLNTATDDVDLDQISDTWERQIIDASGGLYTNVSQVAAADDFDADGIRNGDEFVLGTDPVTPDRERASLLIAIADGNAYVGFNTIPAEGTAYAIYSGRFYTLHSTTNLVAGPWVSVPGFVGRPADGEPVVFTNALTQPFEAYRFDAELRPIRP